MMRNRARIVPVTLATLGIALGLVAALPSRAQYSLSGVGQLQFGYDNPVLSVALSATSIQFNGNSYLWGSIRFMAFGGPYGMYVNAGLLSADYFSPSPGVHKAILTSGQYWHTDYRHWIPGYSDTIVSFPAYTVVEVTTFQDRPGTVRGGLVRIGFRIYDLSTGTPVLALQSTQPPPVGSPYAIGDPNLPYYELEPFVPGGYMVVQFP